MCIIVYKPNTSNFPKKDILKNCFSNNDDGAGYMYAVNGKVIIRKGFMKFKEFWDDLGKTRKKYGDNIPCVMHFRISTQAGINPTITHPYPVSDRLDDLRQLRSVADVGVAHNGIIDFTSDYKALDRNDTMSFVLDYLSLIADRKDWYTDDSKRKLIANLIGVHNKLAILSGDGHCELIGDFISDTDGCMYSNYSYTIDYSRAKSFPAITEKDWEDYYGHEWDDMIDDDYIKYENMWNKKDNVYDFTKETCPYTVYGDCSWCCDCRRCKECNMYLTV